MFARLLVDKTEVEVLDGSVIVDNERIGELLVLTYVSLDVMSIRNCKLFFEKGASVTSTSFMQARALVFITGVLGNWYGW